MKAGIIFTGTGPILILNTYESFISPAFAQKLRQKGIKKYIAYEVEVELCRERYGEHCRAIMEDIQPTDDLRVLDYNGHNIFHLFSFKEMGAPQFKESEE